MATAPFFPVRSHSGSRAVRRIPIVLDLGNPGLAFTPSANGVQFDINGDGAKDQVAWTAGGQDGILAIDLDGSGKIESGNELFSPTFDGGHFANGIAALASLDSNHDGVIDATDPAFSKLLVWQDANHNGISDAGELTKLSDLGITSIDLTPTAGASTIDGQTIAATGSFTYADGSNGSFVEADLDASLGAGQAQPDSHPADAHSLLAAVAAEIDQMAVAISTSARCVRVEQIMLRLRWGRVRGRTSGTGCWRDDARCNYDDA